MRTAARTAGLVAILLAAACADPSTQGPPPAAAGVSAAAIDEFDRRAPLVAAAWRDSRLDAAWRSGFRPLQALTLPPPGPLPEQVDAAISAGWLRADADLPGDRPGSGEVVFDDGGSQPVPLVSATEAFRAMYGGEPTCPEPPAGPEPAPTGPDAPVSGPAVCAVLTVTAARLGVVSIRTSRGPAEVPAWLFDLAETDQPLARVAVAPEAVGDLPRLEGIDFPYQEGLVTAMHLVRIDGADLRFAIGIGSCDVDPAPLVYETAEVVVVAGTATRDPGPGATVCTDDLRLAEVAVTLEAPVGARPVLATTGEVLTFGRW